MFLTVAGVAGSSWTTYTAWTATNELPSVSLVVGFITAGLLLAWLVWVTERTVKLSADRYARFILEAALEQDIRRWLGIHFLNVKEGDCSIIEHNSGRTTVIDVCNAKPVELLQEAVMAAMAKSERGISGNFQQKKFPVNPISYMNDHGIDSIFRYVQTHPDMDHMDGIEALFHEFTPTNFWDTGNTKQIQASSWQGSPYRASDWKFYNRLRDTDPHADPKRLTLYPVRVVSTTTKGTMGPEVVMDSSFSRRRRNSSAAANEADEDYNRCSYVILYCTGGSRIVFAGDSHDETWDHILKHHKDKVTDIDLLIAPHHGRKSGRSYEFLKTLTPTLTFFGNARSQHLAYPAWNNRGLPIVTNNQANCMVVDTSTNPMMLYVTHGNFARRVNSSTYYSDSVKAWYVGRITEDLIP